jgi:hypothetical protein
MRGLRPAVLTRAGAFPEDWRPDFSGVSFAAVALEAAAADTVTIMPSAGRSFKDPFFDLALPFIIVRCGASVANIDGA